MLCIEEFSSAKCLLSGFGPRRTPLGILNGCNAGWRPVGGGINTLKCGARLSMVQDSRCFIYPEGNYCATVAIQRW